MRVASRRLTVSIACVSANSTSRTCKSCSHARSIAQCDTASLAAAEEAEREREGRALAKLLHTMYELEQLEEEVIMQWAKASPEASVCAAVRPVLEFLEGASSESSSESGGEA